MYNLEYIQLLIKMLSYFRTLITIKTYMIQ